MAEIRTKVPSRYGLFDVPDKENGNVSRFLARHGEWAEYELEFIAANVQEASRIADIGAHLGTFGIGISHKRKLDSICFVEANENIVPFLRSNVRRNAKAQYDIVEALACPAGLFASSVTQTAGDYGSTSFAPCNSHDSVADVPPPKEKLSLGELWEFKGPFQLLKLDVEGMEFPILDEARKLITSARPNIWAECNESTQSLSLAELLLSCGLEVYYFAFPSYNPSNFNGDKDPIFPFAYEAGLFAGSGEPKVPEALIKQGCLFRRISNQEDLRLAMWQTPRWCPKELIAERVEEVLGASIHLLQGKRYADFLAREGDDKPARLEMKWSPVADLADLQTDTERALRRAEKLVDERSRRAAERARKIHELAADLDRKHFELVAKDELAKWLEGNVKNYKALLEALTKEYEALTKEYEAIIRSYTWRVTRPVRAICSSTSFLRAGIRESTRTVGSLLRRLRLISS